MSQGPLPRAVNQSQECNTRGTTYLAHPQNHACRPLCPSRLSRHCGVGWGVPRTLCPRWWHLSAWLTGGCCLICRNTHCVSLHPGWFAQMKATSRPLSEPEGTRGWRGAARAFGDHLLPVRRRQASGPMAAPAWLGAAHMLVSRTTPGAEATAAAAQPDAARTCVLISCCCGPPAPSLQHPHTHTPPPCWPLSEMFP